MLKHRADIVTVRSFIVLSIVSLLLFSGATLAQSAQGTQQDRPGEKIDTTGLDLKTFSLQIIGNSTGNYEKAENLLNWLCSRLEWKATDYRQRTVKEILARGGGNCFELAKVYMAMIKELQIQYRPIAEINIHQYNEQRQETAEQKVRQAGNTMSVFGLQHNDHRWVEVFDDRNNKWIPVDPSMNVIGEEEWLKARVWFGKRVTIDTDFTNDMIVPFAIFVVSDSSKSVMTGNRTQHYLVEDFDKLYDHKLSKLPSWQAWTKQLDELDDQCKAAFEGNVNLHGFGYQISALVKTYEELKKGISKHLQLI